MGPEIVERGGKRYVAFPNRSGLGRELVEIPAKKQQQPESKAAAVESEKTPLADTVFEFPKGDGTTIKARLPRRPSEVQDGE